MKKNIAVIWGGYSSEWEISKKSANGIYSFIDADIFNVYKVKIDKESWEVDYNEEIIPIDKNDFSFILNGSNIKFDFAYITIHGTPGEDGLLQGYLDMLGVPYSCCGVLASAITFSKQVCKDYLKNFGINIVDSIVIRKGESFDSDKIIEQLGTPVFVKPNKGGSSFATNRVSSSEGVAPAVAEALTEACEVIIESFIDGREITCGCFETKEGKTILPISEVIPKNVFFDYKAKYEGESDEITPANLSEEIRKEVEKQTSRIYDALGAKGIIRVDYIIQNNKPIFLEVNTTPGMTAASFVPQQMEAAGLNIKEVFTSIINWEIKKENSK